MEVDGRVVTALLAGFLFSWAVCFLASEFLASRVKEQE